MTYSIYFYGVEADYLAGSLLHPSGLVEAVLDKLNMHSDLNQQESKLFRKSLECGLRGEWSSDNYFPIVAFQWLLETIAESIEIPNLLNFKRWNYWESTGLDNWFNFQPPIAVPIYESGLPRVGFLPCSAMNRLISSCPSTNGPSSLALQTLVIDMIESIKEDNLDLIMVGID